MSEQSFMQLKELIGHLPKSKILAGASLRDGKYKFYLSGKKEGRIDEAISNKDAIIMGDGGVANIDFAKGNYSYSSHNFGFFSKNKNVETRYLYRALENFLPVIDYQGFVGSGIKNIDKNFLFDLYIQIPPLSEQKKIASILTSVDDVIETTQKQIDKLQDLKKATMNELLTKGIGHTEFKDSELGRIPKSWRVLTLGELGEFKNGINKPKEAFGSGTKFVNISDAYSVNLDCKSLKRVKVKPQEIIDYKLEMGDLVFVRSSVKLEGVAIPTIFKSYVESVIFCGFMIRFRSRSEEVVPEYLREYLLTDKPRILMQRVATGGANININQEALSAFKVLLPTKDEQKYIIKKTKLANIQIAKLTLKHTKFQSLKKSLMQDLLTGKVRVKVN